MGINRFGIPGAIVLCLIEFWCYGASYNMDNTPVTLTCGSHSFYDAGGSISNYGNNELYVKTFTAPVNKGLTVVFNSFDVELHASCNFDFLEIYDGPEAAPEQLIGKYCNGTVPATINSTGRYLTFKFDSDGATVAAGWDATISCHDNQTVLHMDDDDETLVDGRSYLFYDDGGKGGSGVDDDEGNYSDNILYTKTLTAPTGKFITLDFFVFDIESHVTCNYDHLKIYDGGSTSDPVITTKCGTDGPDFVISSSNELTIEFDGDVGTNETGFEAYVNTTSAYGYNLESGTKITDGCGGMIYDDGGAVSDYSSTTGDFVIEIEPNTPVTLEFSVFDVHTEDDVSIYDGGSTSDPLIGSYDGTTIPGPFTSTGNAMTIKFNNAGTNEAAGFAATWSTTLGAGGGQITGNDEICLPAVGEVYSIATVTNADDYQWAISGGTITAGQSTNSITVTWNTAGVQGLTVTPSNDCFTATSSTKAIDVASTPTGGTMSGNTNVCSSGNEGTVTYTPGTGSVAYWEQAGNTSFTNSTKILHTSATLDYANLAQTTYYRAVVNSSHCFANASNYATITVNDLPTAPSAGLDLFVCQGADTTLAGSGTGTWSVISGTATVTTPSSATSSVTGISGEAVLRRTNTSGACSVSDDMVITGP